MRPPGFLFATTLSLSSHLSRRHGLVRVRALSSSLRVTTTRGDDGTIVVAPDDASSVSASVILCHGLGDTAEGWADPARYLANKLPYVKFILPTAPTQPVTLNMGMAMPSWYDIVGLDSRSNELCNGLDEAADRILSLLEDEVARDTSDQASENDDSCGSTADYSRAVLAGFSQGGALALHTGMTGRRRGPTGDNGLSVAGIVVMSGYLPRPSQFEVAPGSEDTPILHCHGMEDAVVPVQATELSRDRVSAAVKDAGGRGTYEVKTYPRLDHSVLMEELDDVAAFLRRVLPPISEQNKGNKESVPSDLALMSIRQLRDEIQRAGLDERARGMFEKSELVGLLSEHLKHNKQQR